MFNLKYLIHFPSGVTDTKETVIDNIITNFRVDKIIKVIGLITVMSGHDAQLLKIQNIFTKCWKQTNIKKLHRHLSKQNFEPLIGFSSHESWVDFISGSVGINIL